MKFLADENIPLDVVESLRDLGHDVRWVRSDMPGISDDEVLAVVVGLFLGCCSAPLV